MKNVPFNNLFNNIIKRRDDVSVVKVMNCPFKNLPAKLQWESNQSFDDENS